MNFKMEYSFPGLNSPNGRPLRFDFVVFDDDGHIDFIIGCSDNSRLIAFSVVSAQPRLLKHRKSPLFSSRTHFR